MKNKSKKVRKIRPGQFLKVPIELAHLMQEVMFTGKAIERLTQNLVEYTTVNETRRRMFWERVWKMYPELRSYDCEFRIERGAVKAKRQKGVFTQKRRTYRLMRLPSFNKTKKKK